MAELEKILCTDSRIEAAKKINAIVDAMGEGDLANIDLSNLSSTGQAKFDEKAYANEVLKKSQITNCLLEVPQNIKLELVDGVLTLKAGSKVIVPNGVGVFNELTISKDLTLGAVGVATAPSKLYVKANGSALVQWMGEASGATVPTTTTGFYNTADNTCKLYNADGTAQHTVSFPIANVHRTSGSWDRIDQVFNGFGYIGNTIFCDKGVKGLIPNGFNADGTLNNIEFTTKGVLTATRNLSGNNLHLGLNGGSFSNFINNNYRLWKRNFFRKDIHRYC